MDKRRFLLFIFSLIVYYVYTWFYIMNVNDKTSQTPKTNAVDIPIQPQTISEEDSYTPTKKVEKQEKNIPVYMKDTCSVLEAFTEKPLIKKEETKPKEMEPENNTITVIGITIFLVILVLNAILDVLKVKEEERARLKLHPEGERRKSLSEFANKKSVRRQSSKFGLQLFQIAESDKKNHRESRLYTRGDSINSYLSDKMPTILPVYDSAPPSVGETPTELRIVKGQSVAKSSGARPAPMVRRSSYPALPFNPEIQALMLGSRQPSLESDDEDGRGRRVRIIRRY